MSASQEVEYLNQIRLNDYASSIRKLGKRAVEDVVEIGRILIQAKELAGHGNWLPWLKKEFGWADSTARNFMRVHEMAKTANFVGLNLPVSSLYLLAAPSTPPGVAEMISGRAAAGEEFTRHDIEGLIHSPAKLSPGESTLLDEAIASSISTAISTSSGPTAYAEPSRYLAEQAAKAETVSVADKYLSAQSERLGPVAPLPKIDERLAMLLKGKKGTLQSWVNQHKGDDIPEILAALSVAIDRINNRLGE